LSLSLQGSLPLDYAPLHEQAPGVRHLLGNAMWDNKPWPIVNGDNCVGTSGAETCAATIPCGRTDRLECTAMNLRHTLCDVGLGFTPDTTCTTPGHDATDRLEVVDRVAATFKTTVTPPLNAAITGVSAADGSERKRLAFIGDSVLGLVTTEVLAAWYPLHAEGQLTIMRSSVVCNSNLAAIARRLDLEDAVPCGVNSHTLATVLEAVIGAVYLQHGLSHVTECVLRLKFLEAPVEVVRGSCASGRADLRNARMKLKERCDKHSLGEPTYEFVTVASGFSCRVQVKVSARDAARRGVLPEGAGVNIEGSIILAQGTGIAANKKSAGEHAAQSALNGWRTTFPIESVILT